MAVQLYLVRHGVARDRGPIWPDDAARPLTGEGVRKLREAVSGLKAVGVTLDGVLTSPLVRARQTAELLADGLTTTEEPVRETRALMPGADDEAIGRVLAGLGDWTRIALVGHEPGIGRLAGYLMAVPAGLEFQKGAIARIDVGALPPRSAGRLRWFLTPGLARALAPPADG